MTESFQIKRDESSVEVGREEQKLAVNEE